jgi:hypothetical protein
MRIALLVLFVLSGPPLVGAGDPSDRPATKQAIKPTAKSAADGPAEKAAAEDAKTPDAPLAETVRKLIRELDAPQKSRRLEAEKKLLALGAKVLDHLPENTDNLRGEVKLRLDHIREQLEKADAQQTVEPTSVTLHGEMPLSKALAELEEQTGNKLVDLRPEFNEDTADPDVRLEFDKAPFWQVLDQVLDQANLGIYLSAEEGGLGLVSRAGNGAPRVGRAIYTGAFRMEATELVGRRDLRNPTNQMLTLLLEAAWEPRLQPIAIMQPLDAVEAVDDNGQPVQVASAGNELEIDVDADLKSVELPLQFNLPERNARRIARLKGKLTALLPGKVETFRFGNLEKTKRVERRRADVAVVLDEVRKNGSVWEVRVLLVFERATGALQSHLAAGWIDNNKAFLEAADKEKLPYAGLETTRQTDTEAGVAYKFVVPKGLKGYTFVYQTPTAIVSLPIEYELKDLDLP